MKKVLPARPSMKTLRLGMIPSQGWRHRRRPGGVCAIIPENCSQLHDFAKFVPALRALECALVMIRLACHEADASEHRSRPATRTVGAFDRTRIRCWWLKKRHVPCGGYHAPDTSLERVKSGFRQSVLSSRRQCSISDSARVWGDWSLLNSAVVPFEIPMR